MVHIKTKKKKHEMNTSSWSLENEPLEETILFISLNYIYITIITF